MATYYNNSETDLSTVSGIGSFTDGDTLIFATGAHTVSAGLTTLDGASKNANLIKFARAFTGTVNASLVVACSNGTRPRVWYDAASGTVSAKPRSGGTWTKILCTGTGTFNLTGEIATDVEVNAGTVSVDAAAVATNLWVDGGTLSSGYNATGHTLLEMHAGTANIQRDITTGYITGGVLTVFRSTVSGTQPVATTLRLGGDAEVTWRGGNITTLYVLGDATFDSSQAPIGGTIGTLYTTPEARARSNFTNMTITTYNIVAEAYRAAP